MRVHQGMLPLVDHICVKSVFMIFRTAGLKLVQVTTTDTGWGWGDLFPTSIGTFYSQAIFETTI